MAENSSDKVPKGTPVVVAGWLVLLATLLDVASFAASANGATAVAFMATAAALTVRLLAGALVLAGSSRS